MNISKGYFCFLIWMGFRLLSRFVLMYVWVEKQNEPKWICLSEQLFCTFGQESRMRSTTCCRMVCVDQRHRLCWVMFTVATTFMTCTVPSLTINSYVQLVYQVLPTVWSTSVESERPISCLGNLCVKVGSILSDKSLDKLKSWCF